MKTSIDLPDDLLIKAKIKAAKERKTLKDLVIAGLRKEIEGALPEKNQVTPSIRWVTADGGLPEGIDAGDRESLHHIISRPS